eukprot:gnl/MRDRNA2_/MRDRNA2_84486_c0_seq1.p1 gnl/MRDRNA2_/MRDRNA2_84486_c0~~gnl/MRDRNA2_/MRDRNA2_84486_c0_seq1.p1  ORF type:complete len:250 (+),score=33.96 gnl/MRDRNA2_/MRDRNA2_84486_c0_seq1:2-751(+)
MDCSVDQNMGNTHSGVDMLVNKMLQRLIDWTYTVPPMHQTDLDQATLGKCGHIAIPLQSAHCFAIHHLPAGRPRLLPNLISRMVSHSEGTKQKSSVQRPAPVFAAAHHLEAADADLPMIPISGHIQQIHSEEEFNDIVHQFSGLVMLEVVSRRKCLACTAFARTYQQIAIDHSGKAIFLKLVWDDTESTHKLAVKLGMKEAPSFVVFHDGKLMATTKLQPLDFFSLERALRSTLAEYIFDMSVHLHLYA